MQRRENRPLRVHRPENDNDVREMVEEGLIIAVLSDGSEHSATVLDSVTDAGRRFLQIFPAGYRLCDVH
jgi:hypothetical protein